MQPLHEAGRPGMPRLSAGVADTPFAAGLVEPAAKLVALIGQEPLDLPARFLEGRHHTPSQEVGRGGRREVEADLGDAVGASRIAGCVLTDLSRALVFADLERVQANQFPGFARLNVRRLAALSGAQHTPGAFGQEPRRLSTLGFEHRQALAASLQAGSSQQAVGGAGGHLPAAVFGQAKLESPLHGPPGRPGDRQGQNGSCGLRTQHRRPTGASGQAPGVQAIRTIGQVAPAPTVEQTAGDPGRATRLAHIPAGLRLSHQAQAERVYTAVEGLGPASPYPCRGTSSNGKDTSHAIVRCLH